MPFVVPTLQELIDELAADYQNRFPNANVAKRSDNWKRVANMALAAIGLHRHLAVVAKDVLPDTAGGDELDRHGSIYGVSRKGATAASAVDALRLTGTVGAAYTMGDQLASTDGLTFQVNETGVIPSVGYVDVDVLSVSTGAAARKSAGTAMTFITPPSGIDASATLQKDMDQGGVDRETDEEYRVRVLDTIAQPGMGGNANDYRQWAKEYVGVVEAYVYPLRGGLGSVHVAALKAGTGATRVLSGGEAAALKAYVDALRPVSVADFVVLTVATENADVELQITPEDDAVYAFDWSDQVALAVSTYTAASRTVKFTTARPGDLAVGDRITWKRGTANSGKQHTIEAFGAAADEVILKADSELDDAAKQPAAGNPVYAGGPLVDSVRNAIVAHLDGLGPGRADTADATKNYSYGSSYWEGTLRPSKLYNLAQKQKGVLDTTLVTPAANVNPANVAPTTTVGLLVPRQVLIRRKW